MKSSEALTMKENTEKFDYLKTSCSMTQEKSEKSSWNGRRHLQHTELTKSSYLGYIKNRKLIREKIQKKNRKEI